MGICKHIYARVYDSKASPHWKRLNPLKRQELSYHLLAVFSAVSEPTACLPRLEFYVPALLVLCLVTCARFVSSAGTPGVIMISKVMLIPSRNSEGKKNDLIYLRYGVYCYRVSTVYIIRRGRCRKATFLTAAGPTNRSAAGVRQLLLLP